MSPLETQIRGILQRRRRAYQTVFAGPAGEFVLLDQAKFCRAYTTTFHADPRVAAQLDGRREVFLRTQNYLNLTDDQLWGLVSKFDNEK